MSPASRYPDPRDIHAPVAMLSLNGNPIPAHNPADVAAELVVREWRQSEPGRVWEDLVNTIQRAVQRPGVSKAAWWNVGDLHGEDQVEHGARLGYALALTAHHQRDGWEAWLRAAHAELARSGCSTAEHLAPEAEYWEGAAKKIRKEANLKDED